MSKISIMQGESLYIPIYLEFDDSSPVSAQDVGDIEVMIGRWQRRFAQGEIEYVERYAAFLIPVSQEESFALPAGPHKIQVRIKSVDGHVMGENTGELLVKGSLSKVVM